MTTPFTTAITVAAAAVVLAGCGSRGPTDAQRQQAKFAAGVYCSLDPANGSIYSDTFARCVKDREPIELARIMRKGH